MSYCDWFHTGELERSYHEEWGFSYVGPVVIYSHMQAAGLINDHDASCPRRAEIIGSYPCVEKRRYGEKGLAQF